MKEFRQAAADGDLEKLKQLYEEGLITDPNESGPDSQKTALHWAAQKGHLKIVQYLVNLKGIRIDAQDKEDNTPFNLLTQSKEATLTQKLFIADCLMNKRADPLKPNKEGKTPFNYFTTNITIPVREQGTSNQQDFWQILIKRIKDVISERALSLKLSAAIRKDGTVVFGENSDLTLDPQNYFNLKKIQIIGFVDTLDKDRSAQP